MYGITKTIQGSRGYMKKGTEIYGITKTIQGSREYMSGRARDIRGWKDDTGE